MDTKTPEECVMCCVDNDRVATGKLKAFMREGTEWCSWCELGTQKQKEHDLKKLVMPKNPEVDIYNVAEERELFFAQRGWT